MKKSLFYTENNLQNDEKVIFGWKTEITDSIFIEYSKLNVIYLELLGLQIENDIFLESHNYYKLTFSENSCYSILKSVKKSIKIDPQFRAEVKIIRYFWTLYWWT